MRVVNASPWPSIIRVGRRCSTTIPHAVRRPGRGIPCIGTVGLVLTGHRLGIVPSVPDALQTLRDAGMYISDGLFRLALDQAWE